MVARGVVDIGVYREVSFRPHFFEHHHDHEHRYNTTTTRKYKDYLLDPDRLIHKVTHLALMISLTIHKGKKIPVPRIHSRAPQGSPFRPRLQGPYQRRE